MSDFMNRRQFMTLTAAGSAAMAVGAHLTAHGQSPNETVIVGVVGMSRGRTLAETFSRAPNCSVKYVCDTDSARVEAGADAVAAISGRRPQTLEDLRSILDDPEVDAIVMALPVHWHAPAAILACRAGKHVYVEKPCCHNPREGELLVEAAGKYKRAVQMGNQRRSTAVIQEALARLHAGEIGRAYYARSWYASQRGAMGRGVEAPVPAILNYEQWQGPAPRRPYKDNVIHYNWHWLWHWGTGELGNNGTHMLDICRWGLQVDYPVRVTAAGGRYRFADDQETPDTLMVSYDFAEGKTATWEGLSCNIPGVDGITCGVTFYCESGSLTVGSTDYILRDKDGHVLDQKSGALGDAEHAVNFLEAIRNNAPETLHSEIGDAYKSTLLSHLGNIAYRTRHSLNCSDLGHIREDSEAQALWQREYEPGWEPMV